MAKYFHLSVSLCLLVSVYRLNGLNSLSCHCQQQLYSHPSCVLFSSKCYAYTSCAIQYSIEDCHLLGFHNCLLLNISQLAQICSLEYTDLTISCCNSTSHDGCDRNLPNLLPEIPPLSLTKQRTFSFIIDISEEPTKVPLDPACLWTAHDMIVMLLPLAAAIVTAVAMVVISVVILCLWCRKKKPCRLLSYRTEAIIDLSENNRHDI